MSAFKRQVERKGSTWTIQYWTAGADNTYHRSTQTLGAPVSFKAIRSETAKERVTIDVNGEERTLDAQLIIASDAIVVTDIEDTTKRAPIVTDPAGLIKYDVIALGREGEINGHLRLFLLKRKGGSA